MDRSDQQNELEREISDVRGGEILSLIMDACMHGASKAYVHMDLAAFWSIMRLVP